MLQCEMASSYRFSLIKLAAMLRWHGFLTARAMSRYFPNNWNMKSSPIYAIAWSHHENRNTLKQWTKGNEEKNGKLGVNMKDRVIYQEHKCVTISYCCIASSSFSSLNKAFPSIFLLSAAPILSSTVMSLRAFPC